MCSVKNMIRDWWLVASLYLLAGLMLLLHCGCVDRQAVHVEPGAVQNRAEQRPELRVTAPPPASAPAAAEAAQTTQQGAGNVSGTYQKTSQKDDHSSNDKWTGRMAVFGLIASQVLTLAVCLVYAHRKARWYGYDRGRRRRLADETLRRQQMR